MRAILVVLVLATPIAAAASFFALPAPSSMAAPCGPHACFPLAPEDAAVRVEGGRAFAFLAVDGAMLLEGSLCEAAILDVPAGAVALRVDPAPCAQ